MHLISQVQLTLPITLQIFIGEKKTANPIILFWCAIHIDFTEKRNYILERIDNRVRTQVS